MQKEKEPSLAIVTVCPRSTFAGEEGAVTRCKMDARILGRIDWQWSGGVSASGCGHMAELVKGPCLQAASANPPQCPWQ